MQYQHCKYFHISILHVQHITEYCHTMQYITEYCHIIPSITAVLSIQNKLVPTTTKRDASVPDAITVSNDTHV